MAFHHMGKEYETTHKDPNMDELDSCAYQVLVALFSLIEGPLQQKLSQEWKNDLNKGNKPTKVKEVWTNSKDTDQKRLQSLLNIAKGWGQKKTAKEYERILKNDKLNYYWKAAKNVQDSDQFRSACAELLAHFEMGNMPGEQCTAVVRDQQRCLYVTGNGLWTSTPEKITGEEESGIETAKCLKEPWFSSWCSCEKALKTVAKDILVEYRLSGITLIHPTSGDYDGKFHAEMQLLEYMLDSDILPERGYVGVSKPCCKFCKDGLNGAGLHFWNEHGARGEDPNKQVQAPYQSYKSQLMVNAFKQKVHALPMYGQRIQLS